MLKWIASHSHSTDDEPIIPDLPLSRIDRLPLNLKISGANLVRIRWNQWTSKKAFVKEFPTSARYKQKDPQQAQLIGL